MKTSCLTPRIAVIAAVVLAGGAKAWAHCDTLDGPVVQDARLALQKGDVIPVLKWVNKAGEKQVREAFATAMKARSRGADDQTRADMRFFETLVRVHRKGEGAPFTGLKPAGSIDPAFRAADQAVTERSDKELAAELTQSVQAGLQRRFANVLEKRQRKDDSVEAGRAYVAAYVEYAHFVEGIHAIAAASGQKQPHLHAADARAK